MVQDKVSRAAALVLTLLASAAAIPMMGGFPGFLGMPHGGGAGYRPGATHHGSSYSGGAMVVMPIADRLVGTHIRTVETVSGALVEGLVININPAGLDDSTDDRNSYANQWDWKTLGFNVPRARNRRSRIRIQIRRWPWLRNGRSRIRIRRRLRPWHDGRPYPEQGMGGPGYGYGGPGGYGYGGPGYGYGGGFGHGMMGGLGGMMMSGGGHGHGMGGVQELEARVEIQLPADFVPQELLLVFSEASEQGFTNTAGQCDLDEQGAVLKSPLYDDQPSMAHGGGMGHGMGMGMGGGYGGGYGFMGSMNMLGGGYGGGHDNGRGDGNDPDFGVIAKLTLNPGFNSFTLNNLGPFTRIEQLAGRGVMLCDEVEITLDGRPQCIMGDALIPIPFCASLNYASKNGDLPIP